MGLSARSHTGCDTGCDTTVTARQLHSNRTTIALLSHKLGPNIMRVMGAIAVHVQNPKFARGCLAMLRDAQRSAMQQ